MASLLINFGNRNEFVTGSYISFWYSKTEQFLQGLALFIKSGLDCQEKCILFTDKLFLPDITDRVISLIKNDKLGEEEENKVQEDFTDSLEIFSYKFLLLEEPNIKWEKFFSICDDFIKKYENTSFKKIRFLFDIEWLINFKKDPFFIFEYQKQIKLFFLNYIDSKCIIIDFYNASLCSNVDIFKLFSCYDGIFFEGANELSYFTHFRELALKDSLTGLYNERYLYERINEEVFRAKRYRGACSLISMKIFKLNELIEKYGEKNINQLLIDYSDILRNNLRKVDLIAFYQSDCFAVLMPETSKKRALDIAERLKKVFIDRLNSSEVFSASSDIFLKLGVSNFPIDTRDTNELILLAEEALTFSMKEEGHIIRSASRTNDLFPPLG